MSENHKQACIIGTGQTEYAKWGGIQDRSEFKLALEAIQAAARDAGIPLKAIDGFASYSDDRNQPVALQVALGLKELRFTSMVWGGGGGGSCGALDMAAAAVETGRADYVVVFRSLAQGQFGRYGNFDPEGSAFHYPFGLFSPAQMLALPLRRHMYEYGTRQEHLAEIALVSRENAHRNPDAVMGGRPLDIDMYMASRIISDPLKLYDCCQENDGACAVIVTSLERARDAASVPVKILASAHGAGPEWGETGAFGGQNPPLEDYASSGARSVAAHLYQRAGITPADVDVAQIYDNFTGQVLMSIEDFGFCGRGEGGGFIADGHIRPTGSLPINTHGGHHSEAYIHGMNHIVEGVRQIKGQSTTQITNAEICLVTGGPGIAPTSAAILSRL